MNMPKMRRLTQIPKDQPQQDRDLSQWKTYIIRNQDLARSIVAGMRKLVLSLAKARNQGDGISCGCLLEFCESRL